MRDALTDLESLPDVRAVVSTLAALRTPWAVAGGWAIDLALGRVTRPHADVDVAVFRSDQEALRAALPGWDFDAVRGGTLVPWARHEWLALPVHEVHARPPEGAPVQPLEILMNDQEGSEWVYRRDPAVRRPLVQAILDVAAGIRVLAPEIVLLYKSKAPRAADEQDFRVALPLLDSETRAWLRAALLRAAPIHPWAAVLAPEA